MTKLTEIIDAASDDAFTSNLLRKVQTVAYRLRAKNLGLGRNGSYLAMKQTSQFPPTEGRLGLRLPALGWVHGAISPTPYLRRAYRKTSSRASSGQPSVSRLPISNC